MNENLSFLFFQSFGLESSKSRPLTNHSKQRSCFFMSWKIPRIQFSPKNTASEQDSLQISLLQNFCVFLQTFRIVLCIYFPQNYITKKNVVILVPVFNVPTRCLVLKSPLMTMMTTEEMKWWWWNDGRKRKGIPGYSFLSQKSSELLLRNNIKSWRKWQESKGLYGFDSVLCKS